MDGKVFKPITGASSTKTRTARYLDVETGEVTEEQESVRYEPDVHEYEIGDETRKTGVKTWHGQVRGEEPHERVVLMVDHVPGNKGESNSENHVLLVIRRPAAPWTRGALGCIMDGSFAAKTSIR